jgi:integrase
MASLHLKFVHAYKDRHGRTRFYFRQHGRPNVVLPGVFGSAEFMAAYASALDGEGAAPASPTRVNRSASGSTSAAVAAYFGSIDFANLATATKIDRRRILERFREANGDKPFAAMRPVHVEKLLAAKASKPHAAKSFLKALRAVAAVALRTGLCTIDPTKGVSVKARTSAHGFRAWTEADIDQFETRWPIGTRERLALALALYTGQRRADIIIMGRQHIRNGVLTVRQSITGAPVVYYSPIHPELQAILAASQGQQMTFLTTPTGKLFAPSAFTDWFGKACRAAGLPLGLSAHGLRKAMCRRLAEAGCSASQIAAISGHTTLREVSRYTESADRARMARTAMASLPERTKPGDEVANPAAGLAKSKRKPLKD